MGGSDLAENFDSFFPKSADGSSSPDRLKSPLTRDLEKYFRERESAEGGQDRLGLDADGRALVDPAPNAIEWVVRPEWCNAPTVYEHVRQYQVIRDYFQLRCPVCNPGGTGPGQPGDLMPEPGHPRSKMYLESEILLVWSNRHQDDVCPRCGLTRAELAGDGFLSPFNQLHIIAGQRCQPLDAMVTTNRGLLSLGELLPDAHGVDLANPLPPATTVIGENGPEVATDVCYAGLKPLRHLRTTDGWTFDVGQDHLVRVLRPDSSREWVKASDVSPGDVLLLCVGGQFGPRHLDPVAAREMGARVAMEDARRDPASPAAASVPREVREADEDSVREFLRGLTAASAHVSLSDLDVPSVNYTCVSRTLASHVRLLLLNLGILTATTRTSTSTSTSTSPSPEFQVEILPAYLHVFAEKVGFPGAIEASRAAPPPPEWIPLEVVEVEDGGEVEMADLHVPGSHSYVAQGFLSHNSGKSFTSAYIGTYMEHRILTLAHGNEGGFHGYLGISPAEIFEMTFLAATDVQSADTIWAKFTEIRSQAPWFRRYRQWITRQSSIQVRGVGAKKWRYDEQEKRIVNYHPKVRLLINSLNSNSRGLRGRTRVGSFVDEISHMQQTDSTQSADEVYRALENSLATVRAQAKARHRLVWLGSILSISSPAFRDDKGMRLLQISDKIPEMYSGHFSTWEFNPFQPEANFESIKTKDPVAWQRDFKADPPGADQPLIHDEQRFRQHVLNLELEPSATFVSYQFTDPTGQEYLAVRTDQVAFDPTGNVGRYVVFDAGLRFDAFAGACAHGEWRADESGAERLVTVFDWIVRMLPPEGLEVYFESAFEIVRDVAARQRVLRAEFDRWNSVQLIQQIRTKLGIFSEQRPTKDLHYVAFVRDVFSGLVELPPPDRDDFVSGPYDPRLSKDPPFLSPVGCALYELAGLEHNIETHKVENTRKGERRGYNSNDVAQCVVHAHRLVQEQGYTERQDDRTRRAKRNRLEGSMSSTSGLPRPLIYSPTRAGVTPGPINWGSKPRGW